MDFEPLSCCALDLIKADKVAGFIAKLRQADLSVASINRQLEVLRRMLKLAVEWGKTEKILPRVEMLPGENHRDRVLSNEEEIRYLKATADIAEAIAESDDPFLLRDVTTLLLDCALRPDECFRLKWQYFRDQAIHVPDGKTTNARRTVPLTQRATSFLEMRRTSVKSVWVFPARTKSGHIEKSTLKKRHAKACKIANISHFVLYTFRHTCLTRWAAYMDPYTLAYLAGHSDFSTTKRYVHPQADTVREAMERAQNARDGHNFGHKVEGRPESADRAIDGNELNTEKLDGRGERIRTSGLLVPNQAL